MNLYQSGLLLAVLGPLAVFAAGKVGISETCANEFVQAVPAVIGAIMVHIHSVKVGSVSLGGKKI